MSCYHPLKGFNLGLKDNGKKNVRITSFQVDHVEQTPDGRYINVLDSSCNYPNRSFREYDIIPCGRCIGCRLQKSKSWADRAVLELQYHEYNYFITLTYNDDNLPYSQGVNEDGEIIDVPTLVKKDLQLFWKSLRQAIAPDKIRYLACGEYGSTTFRPHYHAIVFGLELNDLQYYKRNELGDVLYTSKFLSDIWKKGFVIVGEATHESIAYVARYVTKKLYGEEAVLYERLNITPEFLVMSRKPGLARQYYEDHKEELFNESSYCFPLRDGIGVASPGKYFNNLFELDFDPVQVSEHRDHLKKLYQDRTDLKLLHTSKSYLDMLKDEEYIKNKRTISLQRDKV